MYTTCYVTHNTIFKNRKCPAYQDSRRLDLSGMLKPPKSGRHRDVRYDARQGYLQYLAVSDVHFGCKDTKNINYQLSIINYFTSVIETGNLLPYFLETLNIHSFIIHINQFIIRGLLIQILK